MYVTLNGSFPAQVGGVASQNGKNMTSFGEIRCNSRLDPRRIIVYYSKKPMCIKCHRE